MLTPQQLDQLIAQTEAARDAKDFAVMQTIELGLPTDVANRYIANYWEDVLKRFAFGPSVFDFEARQAFDQKIEELGGVEVLHLGFRAQALLRTFDQLKQAHA